MARVCVEPKTVAFDSLSIVLIIFFVGVCFFPCRPRKGSKFRTPAHPMRDAWLFTWRNFVRWVERAGMRRNSWFLLSGPLKQGRLGPQVVLSAASNRLLDADNFQEKNDFNEN